MRHFLSRFEYDDKDDEIVGQPDPLIVQRGIDASATEQPWAGSGRAIPAWSVRVVLRRGLSPGMANAYLLVQRTWSPLGRERDGREQNPCQRPPCGDTESAGASSP